QLRDGSYSARNASEGETDEARAAAANAARAATAVTSTGQVRYVSGSSRPTPKSRPETTLERAPAPISPRTHTAATTRTVSLVTTETTVGGVAPSAMRTPSSRVR